MTTVADERRGEAVDEVTLVAEATTGHAPRQRAGGVDESRDEGHGKSDEHSDCATRDTCAS